MKKVYLIAGALAVLLSACTRTEVVSVSDGNLIGFDKAFVGNPTKAGLPVDDQYGASKLPPHFFAYANTADAEVVFEGEKVYQSGGSWVYDNLKKWEPGKTYRFAAYAVKDDIALPENVSFDYGTHTLTIEGYTSNDNYQTDLLIAASDQDLATNEPVEFSFGHALAMIKFTLKSGLGTNEITITDFTVSGMYTTGDVSLARGGNITWANQAAEGTPVPFTDDSWNAITTTVPQASDEFVVIPQANSTITVSFTATVGEDEKPLTSTITLDGNGWECGKRYNYVATITASDMDYIEFAPPTVSDWEDYTDVDADID